MAIPVLYWMLECTECGSRLVVHDSYLEFVGTSDPEPKPGAGYGGPLCQSAAHVRRGAPGQLALLVRSLIRTIERCGCMIHMSGSK